MNTVSKWILGILLAGILAVIVLTWGSVGSAVLILALLLAGGYLLLNRFLETHSADDFCWEE